MAGRMAWMCGALVAAVVLSAGTSWAQNFGGGGGGGGGQAIDSNLIRQQLLGRVQTQVDIPDDEWGVIEPKLWKVVTLQAQTGGGAIGTLVNQARGAGGGGRGGRGGNINALLSQALNNGNPLPVAQKLQELQDLVDDPTSSDAQLAIKMLEYRGVVKRAKAELEIAQDDLVGVLTLRQEALLMQLGYVE